MRNFLLLLRGWFKGYIYIWIEPLAVDDILGSCGRILSLNSPLHLEPFAGLAYLRQLSAALERPFALLAGEPRKNWLGIPDLRWIGEVRPDSTDEELRKLAEKADREADRVLLFPWGNPNLPWDKIPRFFVSRQQKV